MARAEAVVIFKEHRAVSLGKARKAVKKAGFKYLGADVVARGELEWSGKPGESDLLLKDTRSEMTLRLKVSDTETTYNKLVEEYRQGNLGEIVQVHGTVIESKDAQRRASDLGAQFSLAVTDWSPGKSVKLPPLVPKRKDEGQEESGKNAEDAWF